MKSAGIGFTVPEYSLPDSIAFPVSNTRCDDESKAVFKDWVVFCSSFPLPIIGQITVAPRDLSNGYRLLISFSALIALICLA